MRTVRLMTAALVLTGCATPPPAPPARAAVPSNPAAAADLTFDPRGTSATPAPDLSRDNRGLSATNGVVESSTSTFDVTTYNNVQSPNGNYVQQSVTERTGTVQH